MKNKIIIISTTLCSIIVIAIILTITIPIYSTKNNEASAEHSHNSVTIDSEIKNYLKAQGVLDCEINSMSDDDIMYYNSLKSFQDISVSTTYTSFDEKNNVEKNLSKDEIKNFLNENNLKNTKHSSTKKLKETLIISKDDSYTDSVYNNYGTYYKIHAIHTWNTLPTYRDTDSIVLNTLNCSPDSSEDVYSYASFNCKYYKNVFDYITDKNGISDNYLTNKKVGANIHINDNHGITLRYKYVLPENGSSLIAKEHNNKFVRYNSATLHTITTASTSNNENAGADTQYEHSDARIVFSKSNSTFKILPTLKVSYASGIKSFPTDFITLKIN